MAKGKASKKSAKKSKKGMKNKTLGKKTPDLLTVSPAEVGKRVDAVLALIEKVEITLGPLKALSETERRFTTGRFRDGETVAVECTLDTADAFPDLFVALAAKDRGKNDRIFESQPTRDDLARLEHLARLAGVLDPIAQGVSDTLLALGARVRDVTTPAYAIGRVASTIDPKVRTKLAPATRYYGAPAVKAQATLRAKKKKQPA